MLRVMEENTSQRIPTLDDIRCLDEELMARYRARLRVEPRLTRQLVSFQANKGAAA